MLRDEAAEILNSNHTSFDTPQFRLLSDNQIEDIHNTTLELLRRVGIKFHHERALELLEEAGAYIGEDDLVRFPPG
ncbi:trimethylamine methyltransferase family protein, partial [Candidatus Bipolaricaulota bacterium]|nr:trimethylamine methyltransferase family protein [Candidatus Bipolaricaulota bacterium]